MLAILCQLKTIGVCGELKRPAHLQVGGFYISNIPVWISWLKYASFIFYSYNLLLKARVKILAHYMIAAHG